MTINELRAAIDEALANGVGGATEVEIATTDANGFDAVSRRLEIVVSDGLGENGADVWTIRGDVDEALS